ncbi:transglycosylase family protein [Streptomyces sp. NPDC002454]
MLSGNGRHRRPRQAPALVVAAGVTSSAIALPLLGATGASAAEAATWDRLAECESGGAWSANDGNGFYGGLQIGQEAWEKHGGLSYAVSPDQASRSQQIAVGERILAAQGPAAWPGCSAAVGLDKGGPAAEVDPGGPVQPGKKSGSVSDGVSAGVTSGKTDASLSTADRPKPENESGASKAPTTDPSEVPSSSGTTPSSPASPSDSPSSPSSSPDEGSSETPGSSPSTDPTAPSSPGTESPGQTPGEGTGTESGEPGATPSAEPSGTTGATEAGAAAAEVDAGTGRHRGEAATEEATASRSEESIGKHASRSTEREALDASYTVKSGDNLSAIADSQGVEGGWAALYDGNKGTVGGDPHHIVPGQSLDLAPEKPEKKQ